MKFEREEIRIYFEDGKAFSQNKELEESFIGEVKGNKIYLHPIEVFYLANIRKASVFEGNKEVSLSTIFQRFYSNHFFVRYNVFRDWKDRGLFITFPERITMKNFGKSPIKKYPSNKISLQINFQIFFMREECYSLAFGREARKFFEDYWFGQWGVYKNIERGNCLTLDAIETLYLSKKGVEVIDVSSNKKMSFEEVLKEVEQRIPFASRMLEVYEDWRDKGFILKTGFKFGTHFRIYFPGAKPVGTKKEWQHSKHVIHVFPKEISMPMSEWSRAIRVAHSVRKTFIMAIPGMKKEDYLKERTPIDFVAWHRKAGNQVEKPKKDDPSFLIISLNEDESLSGKMLASALDRADELGLRLLIAINDRETSVTYYLANRIELPGSEHKYYEIEWFTP
ncbi:MAG: tRNA-intron lyase [Candidatus Aenigmarchaeota archaeon]|nr:tRNA-intron lyase [Candidatus Aenigmarchaeota archaeon]